MKALVVILTALAACTLHVTAASACPDQLLFGGDLDPDPDTHVQFVTPEPEAVLKNDFLQIFVTYSEDRTGALTPLDHIHYNVAPVGSGLARNGEFTMPDLTGRVELFIPAPARNGIYELCVYLARADHTHLSETVCTTFVLATSGISVFLPRNEGTYDTTEVPFEFETYGTDVHQLTYSIDGDEPEQLAKGNTTMTLPALSNGTHEIAVRAFSIDDKQLGNTVTRTFTVKSALTTANARKAKQFLTRARRAFRSGNASTFLTKAQRLLKKMAAGGSVSGDNAALDEQTVRATATLVRKALKTQSKKLARKAIKTLNGALE